MTHLFVLSALVAALAHPAAPQPQIAAPQHAFTATFFSYTSSVAETDSSPFITASGARVEDGTIANNCLPFGTKVRIPSLFGDKEFTVTDRMAPRYGCNSFDIWQSTYSAAKQFGRHTATVEVY